MTTHTPPRSRAGKTCVVLTVNSVLCLLAILPAFALQIGLVMGGAAPGAGGLGAFIAMAGFILPGVPVVSILGSWLTVRWPRVAITFVALPWLYAAVLAGALMIFFAK